MTPSRLKVFLIARPEGVYAVGVGEGLRGPLSPEACHALHSQRLLGHAFEALASAASSEQRLEAARRAYTRLQGWALDYPITFLASLDADLQKQVFEDLERFEPRKLLPPDDGPVRRTCWPLTNTLPETQIALAWLAEGPDDVCPSLAETLTRPRPKMLLHVCCGPDAAGVVHTLKRDFDLVCFWYDPNIQPRDEYDRRLEAFLEVAEAENVPAIVGEYDVDRFFASIKGLEHTPEKGAKCSVCYDLRLERSALEAKTQNCDLFATTLAISPHKVQEKLMSFGQLAERRHGVVYYHRDFKKHDGFNRSLELTRELGLYRQDYCGCLFSLHEGGPEARRQAETLGLLPPLPVRVNSQA